jgi:hypothetical protein
MNIDTILGPLKQSKNICFFSIIIIKLTKIPHANFDSFEAREAAFNQSVFNLIPCKYKGRQHFWHESNQIIHKHLPYIKIQSTAYITSNPIDCPAFCTTRQVLAAAHMSALSKKTQKVPSMLSKNSPHTKLHSL